MTQDILLFFDKDPAALPLYEALEAQIFQQIEGVQVGVTLRQYKSYRGYKISVRTDGSVDASAICRRLGGGGHRGAAGCTFEITDFDAVYRQVLDSVRQELESKGV